MLILTEDDVRALLTMPEAIEASRQAYVALAEGRVHVPLRHHVPAAQGGVGLVMPGYVPDAQGYGVKFVSVMPGNRERDLPVTLGTMMIFDPVTGEPLALLAATYLTAFRTGAGTGVATDLLARDDAGVLAIVGTGGQADAQLEAVLAVRSVHTVRVYNRTREKAEAFCRRHEGARNRDGQPVALEVVDTAQAAVESADIIVAATNSATPVVRGQWLKPGAHVNAVGAHDPSMQEMDEETVRRARVIAVDSRAGALVPGDLSVPLKQGIIQEADLVEVGLIAQGRSPGRQSPDDITVFKSVGHASQDLVTARVVYEKALASGKGVTIRL